MTEQERLDALLRLRDLTQKDRDLEQMVRIVLQAESQPNIGALARHCPEMFDLLVEELEALAGD